MDSIGVALRTEREKRGLSLEDAHESTKITIQNISALEEDRFDSFPNKVYARAFLRDYANFLGLDSGELLTEYEDNWSPKAVPDTDATAKNGSFWRVLGYTLLILIIAAALGAGGYFGWEKLQRERKGQTMSRIADDSRSKPECAVIPRVPPVTPPEPEAPKATVATPEPPAPAVAPQTQTVEVATLAEVWMRVVVDGKTVFIGILPKGQTKTFEGKTIAIRSGKAGAVQLKLNGQLQPPMEDGSLRVPGNKTFTMPPTTAPVAPAAPANVPTPTGQ